VTGSATLTRLIRRLQAQFREWLKAVRIRQQLYEQREARGMKLLRDWLSSEQRSQLDVYGFFDVVGSDTRRRYRIRYGLATNVYEIDCLGRVRVGWCFRPAGPLVAGDVMLAQKIALETNELATLAIANKFPATIPLRSGLYPLN